MKKSTPWQQALALSSGESSDSGSESDDDVLATKKSKTRDGIAQSSKSKDEAVETKKNSGMSFEALSKHGYRGGPSIFKVPPPKPEEKDQDWSWSTGKQSDADKNIEESHEERQRTRAAIAQGEQLEANLLASNNNKNTSFSQKEKRKRDLGQASRGKSYVEEEKRLLRDNGIYSGFDS